MDSRQLNNKKKCNDCSKIGYFLCDDCLFDISPESKCTCQFMKSTNIENRDQKYRTRKQNGCLSKNVTFQSIQCETYHQNSKSVFKLMMAFSKSKILNRQATLNLLSMLPKINHSKLLYDTTENGIKGLDFHRHCNGVIQILIFLKAKDGRIAGGLNYGNWEQIDNEKTEEELNEMFFVKYFRLTEVNASLFFVNKKQKYKTVNFYQVIENSSCQHYIIGCLIIS